MMDANGSQVRDFLVSRRAKVTPQQAGLSHYGSNRRVAGLRREEVALLAGISVDYYTRLEKGNLGGVSGTVLDAIARALQLDEAERTHLANLALNASTTSTRARRVTGQPIRHSVQLILDGMTETAAFVRNGRLDVLAANQLANALYSPMFEHSSRPKNLARFAFLDPRAHELYPDWEDAANTAVAVLRVEAGRAPYDRSLSDLVGELATRSDEFRTRWAAHDVRLHRSGIKHFCHPVVGKLDLMFEVMTLEADDGLTLTALTAEPGTASRDALSLLASWSGTTDQPKAPTERFEANARRATRLAGRDSD